MQMTRPESVDLTKLDDDKAIIFIGKHEDGREVHVAVDIFATSPGFAYGIIFPTEQVAVGARTHQIDSELGSYYARLPLEGTVETGSYDLEITQGNGSDEIESLEAATWQSLPMEVSEMKFFDRALPGESTPPPIG